jgi:hypothetical protein
MVMFEPEFRPRIIDLGGVELFEEMLNRAVGTRVRQAVSGDLQKVG